MHHASIEVVQKKLKNLRFKEKNDRKNSRQEGTEKTEENSPKASEFSWQRNSSGDSLAPENKYIYTLEIPNKTPTEVIFRPRTFEPVNAFNPTLHEYRFLGKYKPITAILKRKTRFSTKEIESLLLLFNKFTEGRIVMLKQEFAEVLSHTLDLTDEYMLDKIVTQILNTTKTKRFIPMNTWVETFSLYLRGTLEEKMKYCFGVYDVSKTGMLRKDTIFR